MNREQAINYLISCGFTEEKLSEVVRALTYQPTTKNDLGVDCISRADVNRLICEYRDDAAETGSERDLERAYGANAVGELISELPSVTPQEPYPCDTCKHNNDPWYTEPCDSCCGSDGYEQKYIEREVLDRIKAKIEQSRYGLDDGLDLALNIIDECIAESENT